MNGVVSHVEFGTPSDPYVRELVETWPPLTADQRLRLGAVLLAGKSDAARLDDCTPLRVAPAVAA